MLLKQLKTVRRDKSRKVWKANIPKNNVIREKKNISRDYFISFLILHSAGMCLFCFQYLSVIPFFSPGGCRLWLIRYQSLFVLLRVTPPIKPIQCWCAIFAKILFTSSKYFLRGHVDINLVSGQSRADFI